MSPCQIHIGTFSNWGYGLVKMGKRQYKAHRLAYALHNGADPGGMCVCHSCDNPACVNPEHLFLGTHADNTADKVRKGRHSRKASHGMAKLTELDVEQIRGMAGSVTQRVIADRFGVSVPLISRIAAGKVWK